MTAWGFFKNVNAVKDTETRWDGDCPGLREQFDALRIFNWKKG